MAQCNAFSHEVTFEQFFSVQVIIPGDVSQHPPNRLVIIIHIMIIVFSSSPWELYLADISRCMIDTRNTTSTCIDVIGNVTYELCAFIYLAASLSNVMVSGRAS